MQIKIYETRMVVVRSVEMETVRFLSPHESMSKLQCGACKEYIGKIRPIALAWGDGRNWRLCNACSSHLEETEQQKSGSPVEFAERSE